MAAPNIVNVTTITGKTATANVTTVTANVITNSAGSSTVLKLNNILLSNYAASTQTANVFLVPAGTDPAQCRIYSNISIAGFDSYIADTERIILESGDSIWANCSAAQAIVMTLSTAAV